MADIRYQRGQIYSIRSKQTEMFYIGSTIQPLHKRFHEHKRHNGECSSKEILKYDDAYIEWIEDFPCNSKKELHRREGQLQREHKNLCVNVLIAGRTYSEWVADNLQAQINKRQVYYQKNKEIILEKNRLHEIKNKQYRNEYRKNYNIKNSEKNIQYQKDYRLKNQITSSSPHSQCSSTLQDAH